jgi:hypothetical protein
MKPAIGTRELRPGAPLPRHIASFMARILHTKPPVRNKKNALGVAKVLPEEGPVA